MDVGFADCPFKVCTDRRIGTIYSNLCFRHGKRLTSTVQMYSTCCSMLLVLFLRQRSVSGTHTQSFISLACQNIASPAASPTTSHKGVRLCWAKNLTVYSHGNNLCQFPRPIKRNDTPKAVPHRSTWGLF
jgi:hypothetical protein